MQPCSYISRGACSDSLRRDECWAPPSIAADALLCAAHPHACVLLCYGHRYVFFRPLEYIKSLSSQKPSSGYVHLLLTRNMPDISRLGEMNIGVQTNETCPQPFKTGVASLLGLKLFSWLWVSFPSCFSPFLVCDGGLVKWKCCPLAWERAVRTESTGCQSCGGPCCRYKRSDNPTLVLEGSR